MPTFEKIFNNGYHNDNGENINITKMKPEEMFILLMLKVLAIFKHYKVCIFGLNKDQ